MTDSPSPPSRVGLVIAAFGFIPFAIGLLMLVLTATGTLDTGPSSPPGIAYAIAGMFSIFGLGILLFGLSLCRRDRWKSQAQRLYPDEPWRWRRDWDEGRFVSDLGTQMAVTGGFAAVWLSFCVIIVWALFVREDGHVKMPPAVRAIFGIGFPLIGGYLLLAFLHQLRRTVRFGRSVLRLDRLPGRIGGVLVGSVACRVSAHRNPVFSATLRCHVRTSIGSGERQRADEQILWSRDLTVDGVPDPDRPGRILVPIRVNIPPGLRGSTDDGDTTIFWTLSLDCDLPGVDFLAQFTVPVFAVAGATTEGVDALASSSVERPATGRIVIEEESTSVRVVFPPMLNPGVAQVPVVIAVPAAMAMWWGWHEADLLTVMLSAPVFACAVYAWLRAWFLITDITAAGRGVRVRKRLLLWTWERAYDLAEDFWLDESWQETGAIQSGRRFKKLKLTVGGRHIPLGSVMHQLGRAQRIRDALNRQVLSGRRGV